MNTSIIYEPGGETFRGIRARIGDRVVGYVEEGTRRTPTLMRYEWQPRCGYRCSYKGKWGPDQADAKRRLENHLKYRHQGGAQPM